MTVRICWYSQNSLNVNALSKSLSSSANSQTWWPRLWTSLLIWVCLKACLSSNLGSIKPLPIFSSGYVESVLKSIIQNVVLLKYVII